MFIENAPIYGLSSIEEICRFIDLYICCSKDPNIIKPMYLAYQIHKHTKTCKKGKHPICRFNYPIPPMSETCILEPLEDVEPSQLKTYKAQYVEIQKILDEIQDEDITFEEFLVSINLSKEEYLKVVCSKLKCPKVFLKRKPNECRVNAYMKQIANFWQGNVDIQFALDPYALAMYIVNYISKCSKGMSTLLKNATKEAKNDQKSLKQQVRKIGNVFLNSVEICAQEAAYIALQLPLAQCSRKSVFINTGPKNTRCFLLKSKQDLEELHPEATNIEAENDIKRYTSRPAKLDKWCLADFVACLEYRTDLKWKKKDEEVIDEDCESENDDDNDDCNGEEENTNANIICKLPGGKVLCKRKKDKIIRFVNYNKIIQYEDHCRERLMLFHPWREEEKDLLGNYDSFSAHFERIKKQLVKTMEKYVKNDTLVENIAEQANILEEGQVDNDNEENTEDDKEVDDENKFVYFDPDRPEYQVVHDIGIDLGIPQQTQDEGTLKTDKLSEKKYLEMVRKLNLKQREYFLHTLHAIKTDQKQLFQFLSGPAGVGKSLVIHTLFQALYRFYNCSIDNDPDDIYILTVAFTGKAAFLIDGITIHSAFHILPNQSMKKMIPLASEKLNTLRTKYKNLKVLIIDEISMVGNDMLNYVNYRLQQIKGSISPFGGIHVLVFGDLMQIKPVFSSWIFSDNESTFDSLYACLAPNVWQDLFTLFELDEIMRQKDDLSFAELLCRLRTCTLTETDLQVLRSRMIKPHSQSYPKKAMHVCAKRKDVFEHNENIFNTCTSNKCVVTALDAVCGDLDIHVKNKLLEDLQGQREDKTCGLPYYLNIGEGLPYEISSNLDLSDGLVNGSCGTLKKIDYRIRNCLRPSILWIKFEEEKIGKMAREKYKCLSGSRNYGP